VGLANVFKVIKLSWINGRMYTFLSGIKRKEMLAEFCFLLGRRCLGEQKLVTGE